MILNHEEHEGHKEKINEWPYDFFVNFVPFVVHIVFNQRKNYQH